MCGFEVSQSNNIEAGEIAQYTRKIGAYTALYASFTDELVCDSPHLV